MKTAIIRNIVIGTLSALAFTACSEQTPDEFQNINGVYFNNRSNTNILQDTTSVTFVYEKGNEMQVPVVIQLLGRPADHDRNVSINVTSADATQGTDYTLPEAATLPAGATALNYMVTLKRTTALKSVKKHLTLTLQSNAEFTLPVDHEVTSSGDTVTTISYGIIFTDQFTTKPKAWEEDLLGTFTQQKFELICRVLNVDPADFNDDTKMTLAMQSFVCAEMTNYVTEQKSKRDNGESYDKDAFDAHGNALSFVK